MANNMNLPRNADAAEGKQINELIPKSMASIMQIAYVAIIPAPGVLLFIPCNQYGGIGGDAFLTSGEAEPLGGGGFYRDVVGVAADAFSHSLLHGWYVRVHLRGLGADGDVRVSKGVALFPQQVGNASEQFLAVNALVGRVGVGKVESDVAQRRSAEHCIAERMDCHVGVAVAEQSEEVLDFHAANPKFTAFDKAVYVKSEAGAEG